MLLVGSIPLDFQERPQMHFARQQFIAQAAEFLVAAATAAQQIAIELIANWTSQTLKTSPRDFFRLVPTPLLEQKSLFSHQVVPKAFDLPITRIDQLLNVTF